METITYRAVGTSTGGSDADPITTEVIRHGLNSAAEQMKLALIRTAFSPVIYEIYDFGIAIYDRDIRLLAQAPSLPLFMGTMNHCVQGSLEELGGEEELEPGDILLYNVPYGSGSHAQDAAMIMPVFLDDGELVGYTTVKGHWLDIGAIAPYCADTTDVFQEGTMFPGVKIYSRGELVKDIHRTVLTNSRLPKFVAGDINAGVVSLRTGGAGLVRLIERYGIETFNESVERMFDHGEKIVRTYFEDIPDGRYVGEGVMDNNGITDELVPFEIVVEVDGSTVRFDYTDAPDASAGPINVPIASTIAASRIAISMLAGAGESPHEGIYRPIEVVSRPGSMFHAQAPVPVFLYFSVAFAAVEVIYNALAKAMPQGVPACSGGDICVLVWWGTREATGEDWADASPHPVGQGGRYGEDGANALIHIGSSNTQFSPAETWEMRNPWLLDKVELAEDSCGPGEFRGGLGTDIYLHMLEDSWVTSAVERSKTPPWALAGGGEARANSALLRFEDGTSRKLGKETGALVAKGVTLELFCGGGSGYGSPLERDAAAVLEDMREGYITEEHARAHYPHVFNGEGDAR